MTDLSTLLSRVESGSGADKELNQACLVALGELLSEPYTGRPTDPDLLTDLNAVVALVERDDPYVWWRVEKRNGEITKKRGYFRGRAPTPARALLAALIRAEMEKVK